MWPWGGYLFWGLVGFLTSLMFGSCEADGWIMDDVGVVDGGCWFEMVGRMWG